MLNKIIKQKYFKQKEVAEATGISLQTIRSWNKQSPNINQACMVLEFIGYKAPNDPMSYLFDRYIGLQADQKAIFWQSSGIPKTTWQSWRKGVTPSLFNYMSALEAMDLITDTQCWATKVNYGRYNGY